MVEAPSIELPEPTADVKDKINAYTPLNLNPGQLIVIEGIDGAGKSTILGALAHALNESNTDNDAYTFTTEPTAPGPYASAFGRAVRHAIKDDSTPPLSVFFLFLADHANHYLTEVQPALDRGDIVICDRYIDSRYAYQSYALHSSVCDPEPWLDTLDEYVAHTDYPTISVKPEIADAPSEALFFTALARAFADDDVLHEAMREPTNDDGVTLHIADRLRETNSPLATIAANPAEWLRNVRNYDSTLDWIQHIQEYQNWSQLPHQTLLIDISVKESFRRKEGDDYEAFEKRDFLKNVRQNYRTLSETEPRFSVVNGEQSREAVVDDALAALVNATPIEQ